VGGSQTVPHSARREPRHQCEIRGERNERQVTFHPTNERGRSSAAQSFRNEFRQHRDELEQEIGRIARELEEMRHVHAIENCEGEATGKDYVGEQSPALSARIPVHYGRKGRSKRHVSSTPVDKGRDKPETTVAENSRPTRESVSRDGCRRRHQIHYNQRGDSQLGFVEHSSEDYSVESRVYVLRLRYCRESPSYPSDDVCT